MDIPGYDLIFKCDRGAFGEVWIAEDAAGRRVALKIIEQPEHSRRELDGLRSYARIEEHPHLIRILHIEELPACLYYTMEPADPLAPEAEEYRPATLSNILLRDGRMDADRVRSLGAELLDGVAALHRAGLVHRDIKPENILYVNGAAKISDIGTLRPFAGTLTQSGTLGFIPPERLAALSGCVSAADDLYALGKVLYCAWSGNAPELFPSIPAELLAEPGARQLNSVISAACAVDPKARFHTADEFAAALPSGVPFGKRLRNCLRRLAGRPLAAVLFVAVIGVLAVTLSSRLNRESAAPPRTPPIMAPAAGKSADTEAKKRRESPPPPVAPAKPVVPSAGNTPASRPSSREKVPLEIVFSDGTPERTRIHSITVPADWADGMITRTLILRNGFNDNTIWKTQKLDHVDRSHDRIRWGGYSSGWIWLPHRAYFYRMTFDLDVTGEQGFGGKSDIDLSFKEIGYEGRNRIDLGVAAVFRFHCDENSDGKPQLSAWSRDDGRTRVSKFVPKAGKIRIEIVRSRRDVQLFVNGVPAFDPIPLDFGMADFGIGVKTGPSVEISNFELHNLDGTRRAE